MNLKRFAIAALIVALAAPAHAEDFKVKILSAKCEKHRGVAFGSPFEDATVSGEMKNLSSSNLTDTHIVGVFRSSAGIMLTTDDAPPTYDPLLPGQSEPFTINLTTSNPAVASVDLELPFWPVPHRDDRIFVTGVTTAKCEYAPCSNCTVP